MSVNTKRITVSPEKENPYSRKNKALCQGCKWNEGKCKVSMFPAHGCCGGDSEFISPFALTVTPDFPEGMDKDFITT